MSPAVQDRRNSQSDAAGGKSTNPASDKSSGARNGGAGGESRIACFQVLRLVDNGRYLDEALRQARHLPDRDRRFVRLLAATCLRRAGQIDSILADLMSRQALRKAARCNDHPAHGRSAIAVFGYRCPCSGQQHGRIDALVWL
jgi:hypothetical protein